MSDNGSNNGKFVNRVSRQVQRKEERTKLKQQMINHKIMNSPVSKKEIYPLVQQVQKLQQTVESMNLLIDAMQRVLVDKKLVTKLDLEDKYDFVQDRLLEFTKIQETTGDYEKRLEVCKKYDIPIDKTVLPSQIHEDKKLNNLEKLELCDKFNISKEPTNLPKQNSK